ncbi:hypothetical protein [Micromonospora siamensis]|uniref:Uncharacterized protein n=1 Tax=Micromonospora siamensis TaxID=299152 RepID=A0A1C5IG62_9ACTN|nr:hypothetical protein [Micromonospora siamensis]SCG57029.1 hypothetical protein GA0074704_3337 [Micromonospora siamensis]
MANSSRPSQSRPLPAGVTDPLLWRLAEDVAAAHQPDENGTCRNLLCAGQQVPCGPLANAERARQLAGGEPTGDRPSGSRRGWPLTGERRGPTSQRPDRRRSRSAA